MDEVGRVADAVVVLRSGQVVARRETVDLTSGAVTELITGEAAVEHTRPQDVTRAPTSGRPAILHVRQLAGQTVKESEITVHQGEIVGVAGLQGSGRDELPYLLSGASQGTRDAAWMLNDRPATPPTPATAADLGIAFVPAERAREGLVAEFSVRENLTLAALRKARGAGPQRLRREQRFAREWLVRMGIDEAVLEQPIGTLSGGNQQRILLAKWLCTNPVLLVITEPTAGVDVGARRAIYELLSARAAEGLAVVIASSDVDDLVEICHRVLVFCNGRLAYERVGEEIGRGHLLTLMEEAHV
jgi:ABC-type sugar transport system ATPase subunit